MTSNSNKLVELSPRAVTAGRKRCTSIARFSTAYLESTPRESGCMQFQRQDSPLGDRKNVVRDARKLAIFGRKHLSKPVSRDFLPRKTMACTDFFFQFVPVKGRGAVNRRLWSKRLTPVCISKERLKNGNTFHSSDWRDGISWVALGEQTALLRLLVRMHGGWGRRSARLCAVNSMPPTPTTRGCFYFGSTETCRGSC